MKVYDISIPLREKMPVWDGARGPRLETVARLEDGDHATVTRVSMSSHSGTHLDAPAHFAVGGATIDEIPVETLVGAVQVVEHLGESDINAADLDAMGVDGHVARVLFKTRNAPLWEDDGFHRDYVAIDASAAKRLVELGVTIVGIDYLSIGPYDESDAPVHPILLGAGMCVLEGLDLREVPAGEYLLVVAPLKMVAAEGAPARAFLIDQASQGMRSTGRVAVSAAE